MIQIIGKVKTNPMERIAWLRRLDSFLQGVVFAVSILYVIAVGMAANHSIGLVAEILGRWPLIAVLLVSATVASWLVPFVIRSICQGCQKNLSHDLLGRKYVSSSDRRVPKAEHEQPRRKIIEWFAEVESSYSLEAEDACPYCGCEPVECQ